VTASRRTGTPGVRPRSVVPGRQRWDVDVVRGRPQLARRLEEAFRESPGVGVVQANPVTGRLLVLHDAALRSEQVGRLVRAAVVAAVSGAAPVATTPSRQQRRALATVRDGALPPPVALALGGAAAVVLGKVLLASPVVRLGAVGAATVVVVRRAWRRSGRSGQAWEVRRSTRHPILEIVGPHRRQLYLASSLSVLGQILDLIPSVFVGWMAVVLMTGESALLTRLGVATAANQLWVLAGATALVFFAVAGVSYLASITWRDLAQSVQHDWRTQIYAHVQNAELRHLEGERRTRLARALTDDVDALGRFLATSPDYFLKLGASLVVLIPAFLIAAPGLAWIAFAPVPVIVWLSFFHQEHAAPDYAASAESGALLNSQLVNNLDAATTIKSFGTEAYEIERIDRLSHDVQRSNRRVDARTAAYAQTVQACATMSLAGALLAGGLDVLSGRLRFQVFSPLIGLPQLVLFRLPQLGDAADQYQRTLAALDRLLTLASLPVEQGDVGRPVDVADVDGDLVLDGVTFAYPGRPPVLRDMSLRVAPRATTGIVGVTGAGKTTIAKLLLRFQDVESGQVLLDGVDVRELRLHDLRRAIGFVAQEPFLFEGTVEDNIRYGSFDAPLERVVAAARLAEADDFIEAMPARYETMVGERGGNLSGGQRQRISLARAILKGAPVLVLDEATSAVDNETEAAIQRALNDFAADRTLVVIAHRLSTIRHADWIYVMGDDGGIVEAGTHQELLERNGVYASLWRLQIGEVRR
jgi:ATP-binding cassette, subfamily B, bacterial